MMRFYYKADVQQKAKILRKVCALGTWRVACVCDARACGSSPFGCPCLPSDCCRSDRVCVCVCVCVCVAALPIHLLDVANVITYW